MLTPWERVGRGGGNAPSGRTAGLQRARRTWDAGTLLLDPSLWWVVGKDPGRAASDPPPSLTKVRGNSSAGESGRGRCCRALQTWGVKSAQRDSRARPSTLTYSPSTPATARSLTRRVEPAGGLESGLSPSLRLGDEASGPPGPQGPEERVPQGRSREPLSPCERPGGKVTADGPHAAPGQGTAWRESSGTCHRDNAPPPAAESS